MANVIIPQRFWTRRGTAAALTAANEILYSGEWCLETDTGRAKYGDGVTAWVDLGYSVPGRADLTGLQDGDVLIWNGSGEEWFPGTPSADVNDLFGFPGGTADFLRADGTFATPSGGGGRGYAQARLKVTGGSVGLADYGGVPTTAAAGVNALYFQPFSVERTITIATLYAEITTTNIGTFRIGVYANDESGAVHVPGALLGETADLSSGTLGNSGGALTPSVILVPGVVYWSCIAYHSNGGSYRAHPTTSFPPAWMGRSASNQNAGYNHYRVTTAWATLPSPYPGGGTLTSAAVPAVFLTE